MNSDEVKMIGDEMVRVLRPVYDQLDELGEKVGDIDKKVNDVGKDVRVIKQIQAEHTDKIDALILETHELQERMGAVEDNTKAIKEKLGEHVDQNREEHDEIREHVGMLPYISK